MINKTSPISEDLLRDALAGGAATVTTDNLRTLREPSAKRAITWRRLMPAGVGLAAVATAAALVTIPSPRPTPSPSPTRITLAAYAGVQYYVGGAKWGGAPVSVYDAATGKAIASVPAPHGVNGFWQVAGTGDDKTFFLTAANEDTCHVSFYRLRLHDDGTPAPVTALTKVTVPGMPNGDQTFAVTKNGTTLAQVTQSCEKPRTDVPKGESDPGLTKSRLNIINLAGGTHRGFDIGVDEVFLSPAWAPDGHHLGFLGGQAIDDLSMRLLDTATARTLDDSRVIARAESLHAPNPEFKRTTITPDGTQAVVLMNTRENRPGDHDQSRLLSYSLATGRLTRDLTLLQRGHLTDRSLLKPSPNGLLVLSGDFFYRVEGTTIHTLPVPSDPRYLGWDAAW